MVTFSAAIESWLVRHSNNEKDFQLRESSFFSGRTYLAFDSQKGWQFKDFSFWQRFCRNFLGMYKETHRNHVQRALNQINIDELDLQDTKKAFIINNINAVFSLRRSAPNISEQPKVDFSQIILPGLFSDIPRELYPLIFDYDDWSGEDVVALKKTCKDLTTYLYASEEVIIRPKAKKLAETLENKLALAPPSIRSIVNSSAFSEIIQALRCYSENGDLTQSLYEQEATRSISNLHLLEETVEKIFKEFLNETGSFDLILTMRMVLSQPFDENVPPIRKMLYRLDEEIMPILDQIRQLLTIIESLCAKK